jgi:hypothetical protein
MSGKMARIVSTFFLAPALLFICAVPAAAITEQNPAPHGTFAGSGAGHSNSLEGEYNSFFGYHAGYANEDGPYNTFLGAKAGNANTSGGWNTFIGYEAGRSNTTGVHNTFVGYWTGFANVDSHYNTYIGSLAGVNNNGSRNVFIGSCAGFYESDSSDILVISNSITAAPLIYGEFDNNLLKINGQLVFPSDGRMKKNIEPLKSSLDRVMRLKAVSYEWKEEKARGKGRNTGLIAQDVETVIPELVHTVSKGHKSLSYDMFVPVLVEAIKEQQAVIEAQDEALASKSLMIDNQQKELAARKEAIRDLALQLAELGADVNKLKNADMNSQK